MSILSIPLRKVAVVEPDSRNAALDAEEVQGRLGERVLVRITSIRKRLLDEDNLCEKYHVDLCRYAGVIPCDEADKVKIEVCQKKSGKEEAERTIVEVFTQH